jgi:hypothetical protein
VSNPGSRARWQKPGAREEASQAALKRWSDPEYRERQMATRTDPRQAQARKLRAKLRSRQQHPVRVAGKAVTYGQRMTLTALLAREQNKLVPSVMEALLVRAGWGITRRGPVVSLIANGRQQHLFFNDSLRRSPKEQRLMSELRAQGWTIEPFSALA